jgi:DNA helicase TIP49 (TBP-interacting protein)
MIRSISLSLIGICLVAVAGAQIVAQETQETPPGMRQMGPMYDTKTETTLKGTVDSVEEVTGEGRMGGRMGGRSMSGTHIVLKTEKESVQVHLGPSAFLEEKKLKVVKGDMVEVLGSRVTMGTEEVVLAREIRRGEDSWTLRDASGRPLWRMGVR